MQHLQVVGVALDLQRVNREFRPAGPDAQCTRATVEPGAGPCARCLSVPHASVAEGWRPCAPSSATQHPAHHCHTGATVDLPLGSSLLSPARETWGHAVPATAAGVCHEIRVQSASLNS
jgi:hypothetical protein